MLRTLCKSKIHWATVTEANLGYVGSITIDTELMRAADLAPYERVQVVNINNGVRMETYCIEGPANSGVVCMNGPAARLAAVGDHVIIISYAQLDEREVAQHQPTVVFVDDRNRIRDIKHEVVYGTTEP